MDGAGHGLVPAGGAADGTSDAGTLLNHAELLLSLAETAAARASGQQEATWREGIDRLLQGVAVLRAQVASSATSVLEEGRRERATIAAATVALRAEAEVLRAEIDVLRRERDLCLTLAVEANSAVSRHLAQWRQVQGAAQRIAPTPDCPANGGALDSAAGGGNGPAEAPPPDGPAAPDAEFDRHLAALAGTPLAQTASSPVSHLTLTIAALPGLSPLVALEQALASLPSVRTCTVASARRDLATVHLALHLPTAPLVVAAEILGLPACALLLDSVDEQNIATRFAPPLPTAAASRRLPYMPG